MGEPIDGKAIAEAIRAEVAAEVKAFRDRHGKVPRLAAILVGNDPASHVYVRNKFKACELAGISCESHDLPQSVSETELLGLIRTLNQTNNVDGILLQLPLPRHLDRLRALDAIEPAKDVDGLHPHNVGLLVQNRAFLIPCTPLGIIEALKRCGVAMAGKRAVVIGRSDLVGKPMALLLLHENATVTLCHSRTTDLSRIVRDCDIVVAALGQPAFVTPDMIQEGAVLLDVGIHILHSSVEVSQLFGSSSREVERVRSGKSVMIGDIHPDAHAKSSLYTPVPGGVGPLTVAMLLRNTLISAQRRAQDSSF